MKLRIHDRAILDDDTGRRVATLDPDVTTKAELVQLNAVLKRAQPDQLLDASYRAGQDDAYASLREAVVDALQDFTAGKLDGDGLGDKLMDIFEIKYMELRKKV